MDSERTDGCRPRQRGASIAAPNDRPPINREPDKASPDLKDHENSAVVDAAPHSHGPGEPPVDRFACKPSRHNLETSGRCCAGPLASAMDLESPASSLRSCPSNLGGLEWPEPPVTRATLAELDVSRIFMTAKLRHDVNFDPDLHFRPNLDGEKGRRKIQRATRFWDLLRAQLREFMADPEAFQAAQRGHEWSLPATLRAVGEILETLVPPEDRRSVAESMGVDMLMQQLSKGVADLEAFALWLSRTLKTHCAPMRDGWVDEMVEQLTLGNRSRDVDKLADGLATLLGLLEAMKLVRPGPSPSTLADPQDVANHQIRCLRAVLIRDAIHFEQTFFLKRIAARKLDVAHAHRWYRDGAAAAAAAADPSLAPPPAVPLDVWAFFVTFARALLPRHAHRDLPDTFVFDDERIVKLRADMLDAVRTQLCVRLFRRLSYEAAVRASSAGRPAIAARSVPRPVGAVEVSAEEATLVADLRDILADCSGASPQARWTAAAPALALQILRRTSLPLSDAPEVGAQLELHLCDDAEPTALFASCEQAVLADVLELLRRVLPGLAGLSPTRLFETAVLPRGRPLLERMFVQDGDTVPSEQRLEMVDFVRALAHVGMVHWRVWARICYTLDADTHTDRPASPTFRRVRAGRRGEKSATADAERHIGRASVDVPAERRVGPKSADVDAGQRIGRKRSREG
jgi:hypothetical protein